MEIYNNYSIDLNILIFILAILGAVILVFYVLMYSKKRKKISDLVKDEDLLEEIKKEKKLKKLSQKNEYPYIPKKILDDKELDIYYRLIEELPFFNVLPKVPYSSFLDVKKGFNPQLLKNKTNKLIADFVICKRDFSVISIIEIEKNTSEKTLEQKKKILENANIPLYIYDLNNPPSVEDLQGIVKDLS